MLDRWNWEKLMQGSEYVAEMNGHIDVLSTYQTESVDESFIFLCRKWSSCRKQNKILDPRQ